MRPNVLIVDDVEDNVMLLEEMLDDFPAHFDSASDGLEALKKVNKQDYALILLDINMPNMDGYECAKEIRASEKFKHIPIIFVTALGDSYEYAHQGYMVGAVDYISKPIDEDMLRSKVNIFLELYNRQMETDIALTQVRQLKRDYERILNFTAEGIIGLDEKQSITFANSAACTLLTTPKDALIGKSAKKFVAPNEADADWQNSEFVQTFNEGQCNHEDTYFFWRNAQTKFPVQFTQSSIIDEEQIVGGVVVFQDISERKAFEDQLVNLAKYDQLTGLANRVLYWEFLEKSIEVARRKKETLTLAFIDLDHFKEVNDTLGHDAGDLLLVQASERLRQTLRSADIISRLGGDEFAIIIQHIENVSDLSIVCQKIIAAFEEPFNIYGQEAFVGCSIGLSRFPDDGEDATALTKSADTAMYSAKKSGRKGFKFFHSEMHERVQTNMDIANKLRVALKKDEIEPFFQAKLCLKTGKVIGAESLARWHHPTEGMISPGIFIPIAEDTGLIQEIGHIMLLKSAKEIRRLHEMKILSDGFRISINVSGKQIQEPGFAKRLLQLFLEHDIPCHRVELELTETSVMSNFQNICCELDELRAANIHISIDDFGTGYSSLAYLKRLPIDTLKIDQAFVRDIGHDRNDEAIVKAVISLGHSLGMNVLAEGVETKEQLDFLVENGCDTSQGFYFSRPIDLKAFEFYLGNQSNKPFE